MKKSILLAIVFFIGSIGATQAQSIMDKWPELKAFHSVMSQTFHPSEEGNLLPIKERSGEMAEKANALAKSTIPAAFKSDKIVDAVKRLTKDSEQLHKAIQSKKISDAEISIALTKLHDVFHEIVGLCKHEDTH